MLPSTSPSNELWTALRSTNPALLGVGVFSACVNALMLAGPVYMLQVYDRVLPGRSTATLLVISLIVFALYLLMAVLDHYRGRILARVGAAFQSRLDERVFRAVLKQAEHPLLRERPAMALKDLAAIQSTLSSPGMASLFDLPWTPIFIFSLFLFHPWMGWFSVGGALLVLGCAILTQIRTKKPQDEASRFSAEADTRTEMIRNSVETVRGLGMSSAMVGIWQISRRAALQSAVAASDSGGGLVAGAKAIRLVLQSAILGLGAFLVLQGELTAGAMIAGSILLGRALAPIEQVVGHLPQFQRARTGWRDLSQLLAVIPTEGPKTILPRPAVRLDVKDLAVAPPGEQTPFVRGITFSAEGGDAIAVIGPSASGKSTLARALAGIWPIWRGEIRLGGADLTQYETDYLGGYLGYLQQEVVLFSGTVAQNIGRFNPDGKSTDVIDAARKAGAHEMVLGLVNGYDTVLQDGGVKLSGGQRQRIGLARAFFGNPMVLVLDEPNSSLDDPGVQALNKSVSVAKAEGRIVILMSHRPSALAECNKVLILEAGQMRAFGPRDEVLSRFVRPVQGIGATGLRGGL